jgi:rhamnosyltransferase
LTRWGTTDGFPTATAPGPAIREDFPVKTENGEPLASVVVRARDEVRSLGRLLDILDAQTIAARLELIVVDSGSTDGTPDVVRGREGVRLIEIPARDFTFGGALNTGCAAASAPVGIALSAHAFPLDPGWAERVVRAFDDERVACVCGEDQAPDGSPLSRPVLQDLELGTRHPQWGYSNACGGFRMELWRRRPWRADMPGTEDREWARHWLERGMLVRVDPGLMVDHDHSHDGLRSVYERSRREWVGYGMYLELEPLSAPGLARRWWADRDGHASPARARLSPWRAAKLLGEWSGRRPHRP